MADDIDKLLSEIDDVAIKLYPHLEGLLPLLSQVRQALPPKPRNRAEVDITALRAGRVLHFLQAAQLLAKQGLGTTLALVARASWETWFDTVWMLHDPTQRYDRANAEWAASIGQQVGLITTFRERDGYLIPAFQAALDECVSFVKTEPQMYADWFNPDGTLRKSVHSIHATKPSNKRAIELDKATNSSLYGRSYDLDYTMLSLAAHGEGTPLLRLMEEVPGQPIEIAVGEGKDGAADYFVHVCSTALAFAYEVQRAYLSGGHNEALGDLGHEIGVLRERCPSWI